MPCANPSRPHVGLPPSHRGLEGNDLSPLDLELCWYEYEFAVLIKKKMRSCRRGKRSDMQRDLLEDQHLGLDALYEALKECPGEEVWWEVG